MRRRISGGLVLAVVIGAIVLLGPGLMGLYVDWLWFGEVAQRPVFWKLWSSRIGLGLAFGLALTGLTYLNLWIARRSAPLVLPGRQSDWQRTIGRVAREGLSAGLVAGSLVLGVLGGVAAAARWDEWIRFSNAQTFPTQDPIFGANVGFYIFQYPFLEFISSWLFAILILITLGTAVVYYAEGAVTALEGEIRVATPVRVHLSVLFGLAMLAKAWDYWLDRYGLLMQPGGVVTFGAGYTDIHARLPALNILMVVAVIAALGFFFNTRVRALWLPAAAVGLMAVASLTVGGLYPGLIQSFVVKPNEQGRERPFIEHHLKLTRSAYGLDEAQTVNYTAGKPLTAADLARESGTLENVRLWDYRILSQTYHGLQRLRDYYHVRNVDIDRYRIGGKYRQVMLAPRELVTDRLDPGQRRWVNEKLQYTHGYGLIMSGVNGADGAGRPLWLIRDLPLASAPDLAVQRPQLYYGMQTVEPVVAPSGVTEIDYLADGETQTSQYSGPGGIPIGSPLQQVLFSTYLGDWNLTISDQIRPSSRILIRRNVMERLGSLAPFLRYDTDPYLVLESGRLVWVVDAYTTADTHPYSAPLSQAEASGDVGSVSRFGGGEDINYLRNSVKATVDAYTGVVTLFAIDENEPVLACYRQAFPSLFRPASEAPQSLREHFRYPEGLFSAQARIMTRFHVTNADVFYAQSDVWEIPREQLQTDASAANGEAARMEPYYVMMRLPGETKEEFVLILPFKTKRGTTMSGWMVARCDPAQYGQLRLYRFPTNSQVDAPEQVDNTIQADPIISPQVSLLDQRGSTVRFGNLLVLPVGSSLLYVKPLYLEASTRGGQGSQNVIPQLEQVIVAEHRGDSLSVIMRPTLREALAALVAGDAPVAPGEPTEAEPSPTPQAPAVGNAAREAQSALDAAEQAQRSGNWAEYGRQLQRLRAALQRLNAAGP